MRFIVALLIASLFVDKEDSELSFIRRHNLDSCSSYSLKVSPRNLVIPAPHANTTSLLSILIGQGDSVSRLPGQQPRALQSTGLKHQTLVFSTNSGSVQSNRVANT
ncbi:UvrABC system protein B [Striga asiatica]|uniref:UvrABC system protein B n=1 Tax=Striga asiatica TaxID=4170 RepID=A0A5A7P6W5_STRAF|nr:UvrABC system protein B [Striga asiatica]